MHPENKLEEVLSMSSMSLKHEQSICDGYKLKVILVSDLMISKIL